MKSPLVELVVLSTLAAFSPTHGLASRSGVSVTTVRTQVAHSVEVPSGARQAVLHFFSACFSDDQAGMARTVTDDAVVGYVLAEPGVYLTVDAPALDRYCGAHAPTRSVEQISNMWIFPTSEPSTVFVQYSTHLALVELRGNRIAKIRDFATSTDDIVNIATGLRP